MPTSSEGSKSRIKSRKAPPRKRTQYVNEEDDKSGEGTDQQTAKTDRPSNLHLSVSSVVLDDEFDTPMSPPSTTLSFPTDEVFNEFRQRRQRKRDSRADSGLQTPSSVRDRAQDSQPRLLDSLIMQEGKATPSNETERETGMNDGRIKGKEDVEERKSEHSEIVESIPVPPMRTRRGLQEERILASSAQTLNGPSVAGAEFKLHMTKELTESFSDAQTAPTTTETDKKVMIDVSVPVSIHPPVSDHIQIKEVASTSPTPQPPSRSENDTLHKTPSSSVSVSPSGNHKHLDAKVAPPAQPATPRPPPRVNRLLERLKQLEKNGMKL